MQSGITIDPVSKKSAEFENPWMVAKCYVRDSEFEHTSDNNHMVQKFVNETASSQLGGCGSGQFTQYDDGTTSVSLKQ